MKIWNKYKVNWTSYIFPGGDRWNKKLSVEWRLIRTANFKYQLIFQRDYSRIRFGDKEVAACSDTDKATALQDQYKLIWSSTKPDLILNNLWNFLSARSPSGRAETESQNSVFL